MNIYESQRLLSEYLHFHYGEPDQMVAGTPFRFPPGALEFPLECVRFFGKLEPNTRALDIGCAVGRATFDLAAVCNEVIGIDFSQNFIDAAQLLKEKGMLGFHKAEEGHRTSLCTARVPAEIERSRVSFERGDAMDLPEKLGTFDYVLAANLLCRLGDPRRFLARLPSLVKPGGHLVLTTPCSWMEEYTARENWLATAEASTFQTLSNELAPHFELLRVGELPFVIREHARKFQCVSAQASLWERKQT